MHSVPQQAAVPSERKISEQRRTTKPIMEKRRRARINNSLNELKNLILDYNKANKDSARNNKLEKADILEMAVRHVQMIHRQMAAQRAVTDPQVSDKYRAGYMECAGEVSRYLSRTEGVESSVRQCLVSHLGQVLPPSPSTSPLRSASPTGVISAAAQKFFGNSQVQLVPTRLPSGEIALVVPGSGSEISVNCNTLNVLGSSGIVSPAASERSVTSPLLTSVQSITPPLVMKMEVAAEEPVWRPW